MNTTITSKESNMSYNTSIAPTPWGRPGWSVFGYTRVLNGDVINFARAEPNHFQRGLPQSAIDAAMKAA